MEKSKKTSIAIIIVSAFMVIMVTLISLLSFDALIKTKEEKRTTGNTEYTFVRHDFAKGSDMELSITANKKDISEELVQLTVIIKSDCIDYTISHLKGVITSSEHVNFINGFFTYDGNCYFAPETLCQDGLKKQNLYGSDCIYYTAVMKKEDISHGITLDINYSIRGKGIYFINEFRGNKHTEHII